MNNDNTLHYIGIAIMVILAVIFFPLILEYVFAAICYVFQTLVNILVCYVIVAAVVAVLFAIFGEVSNEEGKVYSFA